MPIRKISIQSPDTQAGPIDLDGDDAVEITVHATSAGFISILWGTASGSWSRADYIPIKAGGDYCIVKSKQARYIQVFVGAEKIGIP